jgi:hypothetical protein
MRLRALILGTLWLLIAQLASAQSPHKIALDVRQLMTPSEFQRCGLQKLSPDELKNLNGWITGMVTKALAASDASTATTQNSVSDLEGAVIIADDGQFIGKITTNSMDPNSLMNDVGQYGSDVSSTSIFNDVSTYGSDVSSLSPFNSVSSTPPRIFKGNKFIAYLTVNATEMPRIDPYALIAWLKSEE